MRGGASLITLLLASVLAGCAGGGVDPISARTVPADAPSEDGRGDATLVILARDEPNGPPMRDVAIAVSWGGAGDVAMIRTDHAGIAVAHVPASQSFYLSAFAPGWTEERVEQAYAPPSGQQLRMEVPLYRDTLQTRIDGNLTPAAASGHRLGVGDVWWAPQPAEWGSNDEARRGYVARLVTLRVGLTWENGVGGAGDLAVGAGLREKAPDLVQDQESTQVAPGEQVELLAADFVAVYDAGWRDGTRLYVGAGTGTAFVAPLGIPYTLDVTATFDGDLEKERPVPGAWIAAVLAAFAVVALARRR